MGAESKKVALHLCTQFKEILKQGGFNLRKFFSSSTLLWTLIEGQVMMESKPICCEESYVSLALNYGQSMLAGERKMLGIRWEPTTDKLIMIVEVIAYAASHLEPT